MTRLTHSLVIAAVLFTAIIGATAIPAAATGSIDDSTEQLTEDELDAVLSVNADLDSDEGVDEEEVNAAVNANADADTTLDETELNTIIDINLDADSDEIVEDDEINADSSDEEDGLLGLLGDDEANEDNDDLLGLL